MTDDQYLVFTARLIILAVSIAVSFIAGFIFSGCVMAPDIEPLPPLTVDLTDVTDNDDRGDHRDAHSGRENDHDRRLPSVFRERPRIRVRNGWVIAALLQQD